MNFHFTYIYIFNEFLGIQVWIFVQMSGKQFKLFIKISIKNQFSIAKLLRQVVTAVRVPVSYIHIHIRVWAHFMKILRNVVKWKRPTGCFIVISKSEWLSHCHCWESTSSRWLHIRMCHICAKGFYYKYLNYSIFLTLTNWEFHSLIFHTKIQPGHVWNII